MRIPTAVAAALLLVVGPIAAQTPASTDQRGGGKLITFNPLGFAQFGPNVEVHASVGRMSTVAVGMRIVSFGLIPHVIADADDESLRFTWTATAAWMFYPGNNAPRGWFVGPRLEVGQGRSTADNGDTYESSLMIGAAEFGYRWVWPSGFTLSLGGQSGVVRDAWHEVYDTYDRGTDLYPYAMANLAIGMKF